MAQHVSFAVVFGRYVRRERTRKGWTLEDLARELGHVEDAKSYKGVISGWENGRGVEIANIDRLMRKFGPNIKEAWRALAQCAIAPTTAEGGDLLDQVADEVPDTGGRAVMKKRPAKLSGAGARGGRKPPPPRRPSTEE